MGTLRVCGRDVPRRRIWYTLVPILLSPIAAWTLDAHQSALFMLEANVVRLGLTSRLPGWTPVGRGSGCKCNLSGCISLPEQGFSS